MSNAHCFFYAFDALFINGPDLRELPLIERKARLKQIISAKPARFLVSLTVKG